MHQADTDRPILVIEDGDNNINNHTLYDDSMILGRGDDSDIVVADRQVSRHHIRIFRDGDVYYVEELDSKNGTWLNGNKITGIKRLHDGDELNIALTVHAKFIGSNSTAPVPLDTSDSDAGFLRLDRGARRVFVGEEELDPPLSLPQYRLLELLYNSFGRVCTRDAVVKAVWPEAEGEGVSEQAIDALVRRLRDRLAEVDPEWQYVVTVRGHGFRLDNRIQG